MISAKCVPLHSEVDYYGIAIKITHIESPAKRSPCKTNWKMARFFFASPSFH